MDRHQLASVNGENSAFDAYPLPGPPKVWPLKCAGDTVRWKMNLLEAATTNVSPYMSEAQAIRVEAGAEAKYSEVLAALEDYRRAIAKDIAARRKPVA